MTEMYLGKVRIIEASGDEALMSEKDLAALNEIIRESFNEDRPWNTIPRRLRIDNIGEVTVHGEKAFPSETIAIPSAQITQGVGVSSEKSGSRNVYIDLEDQPDVLEV